MILEKVIEIVADQLGVDASEVTEQTNLVDDLGADSLSVVDLIMSIEDEFGVQIPDDAVENLRTIDAIVQFIENNQ